MFYQICNMMGMSAGDNAFLNISFEPQLTNQTWSIDRCKQWQYFLKSFEQFGGLELSSRLFEI